MILIIKRKIVFFNILICIFLFLCRYEARIDCIRRGGDLALIASDSDQQKFARYIVELEVLTTTLRRYWIGLTQRIWTTSDGTVIF